MRVARGLLLCLALAGCSDATGASSIDGSVGGGSAGTSPGIDVGALNPLNPPATTDDLGPLGACVTETVVAQALPSLLQMVVDTSGSMQWPPGWNPDSNTSMPADEPSKWEITEGALSDAVRDLPSDTALGVSFFPNVAHSGSSCIKNQVALPIAALGGRSSVQRERFRGALAAVEPRGGTPTHGAYRFGTQLLTAAPGKGKRFALLITDGIPTYTLSCAGDGRSAVDSAPLIAEATALLEEQDVLTFVIGSPGSEDARSALSRLARAGGTAAAGCSDDGPRYCHFDMTNERSLGTALRAALASISTRITTCEYPVPAPPSGQTLDLGRVNVVYTPQSGPAEVITRDAEGSCEDGWQYADGGKRVVLCGESCERVKGPAGGEVELFFGCATSRAAPR